MMSGRQQEVKVAGAEASIRLRGRKPQASAAAGAEPAAPVQSLQRSTVLFQRVFHSGRTVLIVSQSSVTTFFM